MAVQSTSLGRPHLRGQIPLRPAADSGRKDDPALRRPRPCAARGTNSVLVRQQIDGGRQRLPQREGCCCSTRCVPDKLRSCIWSLPCGRASLQLSVALWAVKVTSLLRPAVSHAHALPDLLASLWRSISNIFLRCLMQSSRPRALFTASENLRSSRRLPSCYWSSRAWLMDW